MHRSNYIVYGGVKYSWQTHIYGVSLGDSIVNESWDESSVCSSYTY